MAQRPEKLINLGRYPTLLHIKPILGQQITRPRLFDGPTYRPGIAKDKVVQANIDQTDQEHW